jgi:predicted secreted protein
VTTNAVFEICDGDATNINLTANIPGTTYVWSIAQSNAGAIGNRNIINQPLTLTGNTVGTVTYTIAEQLGCDGGPVFDYRKSASVTKTNVDKW